MSAAPYATPQHVGLASLFDEDRYDSIVEFSDRAISLWLSIREAAYRREPATLEIHCPQIRVLTLGAFETVKAIGGEKAGVA
jgi:hypothetical protein